MEICSARNNNVQLRSESTANQEGLFDILKEYLSDDLVKRIEWKTNDSGQISVRDIIALAWISLSALDLSRFGSGEALEAPSPVQSYSGKAVVLEKYKKLIKSEAVSATEKDGYRYIVKSDQVKAVLKMLPKVIEAYDLIFEKFSLMYNGAGGNFGRVDAVKSVNNLKGKDAVKARKSKKRFAPFLGNNVELLVPLGFIMPVAYGIRSLIHLDEEGSPYWLTDPIHFIKKHEKEIGKAARNLIEGLEWNPQKVGKSAMSYENMMSCYKSLMLEDMFNEKLPR